MAFDIEQIRANNPIDQVAAARGIRVEKDGNEYRCLCPFHNERTPSLTIFKNGSRFHCFGCGAHGDVIDFVMQHDRVTFQDACAILGGEADAPKVDPASRAARPVHDPYKGFRLLRPDENAPVLVPGKKVKIYNPKRETFGNWMPSLVHPYRARNGAIIAYVIRVDIENGHKITPTVCWCERPDKSVGWTLFSLPEPRLLYGLDRLEEGGNRQVWVVEGEKAADALAATFPKVAAVSWPGGTNGAERADWKSLAGRRVVLWPDNDQPGIDAMHRIGGMLKAIAAEVKFITPDESKVKGWDAADAVADGMTADHIAAWAKQRVDLWTAPAAPEPAPEPPKERAAIKPTQQAKPDPDDDDGYSNVVEFRSRKPVDPDDPDAWKSRLVFTTAKDPVIEKKALRNMVMFLTHEPSAKGCLVWNDFEQAIHVVRRPPWHNDKDQGPFVEHLLNDSDITHVIGWLEAWHMSPTKAQAGQAVRAAAEAITFNPVIDYLKGLRWDGKARLDGWLTRHCGAIDSPLHDAFGRCWMIGAVARVLKPGCKMDTMLVLEGAQGKKKSSAIEALATWCGERYFTDQISDIKSKDSCLEMQGVVIVEISEMDAYNRAETNAIKAWLSRTTDRFRPPYETTVREFPRHCVFAGTMNPGGNGWIKDHSGGRRFWPVSVTDINLEGLIAERDQLWAEAFAAYEAGEKWWLDTEMEAAAKRVQDQRREVDPWMEQIEGFIKIRTQTTIGEIINDCLKIPAGQQTSITSKRVADICILLGWADNEVYHDGRLQKGFSNPQRLAV